MPTPKIVITRQQLVDKHLQNIERLIRKPIRETNGKNRSPDIDSWNKRCGVPKGAPYCASSQTCEYEDTCKELGLEVPPDFLTASSQRIVWGAPKKYVRAPGELILAGDLCALQNNGDPAHGHAFIAREDQKPRTKEIRTYEFNTDPISGDRDGDGGYAMTRSTVDGSRLNAGKKFRAAVDYPQWIIDYNVELGIIARGEAA